MENEVLYKGVWRKSPQWFVLTRRHAAVTHFLLYLLPPSFVKSAHTV